MTTLHPHPGLNTAPPPRRARSRTAALVLAPLLPLALSLAAPPGCNAGEAVDPAATSTSTTTTTTPDPDPGPTGTPPKRTVFLRNPLGEPANNLLVDGDFELSVAAGSGQYGWRMFDASGTGEVAMTVETGGLCRSGLTCARFEKGRVLFGRGTSAPDGKGHVMGLWTRMPEGVSCKKITLVAVDCDTFDVLKIAVPDPDLDAGWCHHHASFGPSKAAVCLYVSSSLAADQAALVDAAVLAPNDGTVPFSAVPDPPLDPAVREGMIRLAGTLRRTRRFDRLAPVTAPPPR